MLSVIALFTYNRPSKTQATLEALAKNKLASSSNLYIFSDAAKHALDEANVDKVRKIIKNVSGFHSITIKEQRHNLGLAQSIISGVTELLKSHHSIIVLEDDLITSPNFLSFMNNALTHYQNDKNIFSVTGHTFPNKYLKIPSHYLYDTYAGYRCSSWSWGTWRDRWEKIDWEMKYYEAFSCDPCQQNEFNRGGNDLSAMLQMQHQGKIDSWAIRFCHAHYTNKMYCIYPTKTLVKNIGLDDSGTHSEPNKRFEHLKLDQHWQPKNFCPSDSIDKTIAKNFSRIFEYHQPSILKKFYHKIFKPKIKANILFVNSLQKHGGAARAAYRLFQNITSKIRNVHYLTLLKDDTSPFIHGRLMYHLRAALVQLFMQRETKLLKHYPNKNLALFTLAKKANPFRIPLKRFTPKLIHLHWVSYSLLTIEELATIKCPIVWTLHDAWAFTGGCHYTNHCDRYQKNCGACPQLKSNDSKDISHKVWLRKQKVFKDANMTIVTPSQWLAESAKKSSLLCNKEIIVIPNGLDTDVFKPLDKVAAKKYFGLDVNRPALLFGTQSIQDPRKGFDLLKKALELISFDCNLLIFGEGELGHLKNSRIHIKNIGPCKDDYSLALVYSAADVFLCPSREDNLPNTVAEALACGTPVVAFDICGLPDMITHEGNGWLAKAFDVEDFARGITWISTQADCHRLQNAARKKALEEYSLPVMTERYLNLYAKILDQGEQ